MSPHNFFHVIVGFYTALPHKPCYFCLNTVSFILFILFFSLLSSPTISANISLSFLSLIWLLCLFSLNPPWPSQRRKMWTNRLGWWNMLCFHSHGIMEFWSTCWLPNTTSSNSSGRKKIKNPKPNKKVGC